MTDPHARGGLFASLRGLFATGLGLLQTRLELLVTEFEEEQCRLFSLLGFGAAAFVLLSAGTVFLAMFLTVLFWDSHRLLVLGTFTLVFLILGAIAAFLARRQAKAGSRLFSASLAELSRDREALRGDRSGEES